MTTDQVERLIHQKGSTQPIHPRDVHRILDELLVQPPVAAPKTLKEFIAAEPEDPAPPGESHTLQAFLTGLTWMMFALALGALGWLTLSAGIEYLTP